MPAFTVTVDIPASPEMIFDLTHDYSRRLDWDTFLRDACLLNAAPAAAAGVTARCVAHWAAGGLTMETVYISLSRPRVAAVRMTKGPALFRSFAATIRQERIEGNATRVTYCYNFQVRPRCLASIIEPVARWVFHRETRRRLFALKRFIETTPSRPK